MADREGTGGASDDEDSFELPPLSMTEKLRLEAAPKLKRPDGSKKNFRDLSEYEFDRGCKSWKAPIRKIIPVMKLTRMISNKEKLLDSQKKAMAKLKVNKEAIQTAEVSLEDDDIEDATSVCEVHNKLDPLQDIPIIRRPFSGKLQEVRYTSWKAPALEKIESGIPLRAKEFSWKKPSGGAGAVSFTSPQQQLLRMDDLLSQKEKELGILRSQLFKAQEENFKLIQVLQGYSGKHYEELEEENTSLRRYLDRVMRDNAKLRGLQMRDSNSTLAKLENEQRLHEKYGVKNACPPIGPNMKAITFRLRNDSISLSRGGSSRATTE